MNFELIVTLGRYGLERDAVIVRLSPGFSSQPHHVELSALSRSVTGEWLRFVRHPIPLAGLLAQLEKEDEASAR